MTEKEKNIFYKKEIIRIINDCYNNIWLSAIYTFIKGLL